MSESDNVLFKQPEHMTDYDLYDLRKRQAETDTKIIILAEKLQVMLDEISHMKAKITELDRRD